MKLGNNEVQLTKIVEKMGLTNLTPQIDTDTKYVTQPDVNRPALQLAGFYDHFDNERVQIIGYVEEAYIEKLDREDRKSTRLNSSHRSQSRMPSSA